jgi:hypothetical protein
METILRTYKFYDIKGRRLAIFGRAPLNVKLETFVLTCSKKDFFSKKKARQVYDDYLAGNLDVEKYHPVIMRMPVVDDDPGRTFMNFCENSYLKMIPITKQVLVLGTVKNKK